MILKQPPSFVSIFLGQAQRGCHSVQDLVPLGELKELQSLDLQGCAAAHLIEAALPSLRCVRILYLGTPIDLQTVARIKCLRQLHLHYQSKGGVDLTPLAACANLELLCVGQMRGKVSIAEELLARPEGIASSGVRTLFNEEERRTVNRSF
jgi:hypothetical protein